MTRVTSVYANPKTLSDQLIHHSLEYSTHSYPLSPFFPQKTLACPFSSLFPFYPPSPLFLLSLFYDTSSVYSSILDAY